MGRILALIRRALRTDIREARPHLFRAALAAVALWMLVILHLEGSLRSAAGLQLFSWTVMLNYWFITIAGATFFASAITEEKEERTLGLLKMAGLGGLSVLLGKWAPRMVGALLLIAIQLPFTTLAVTLGGVLWGQIVAAYLILTAHLIFVGGLGLLASVIMARTSTACTLTGIVLFLIHVAPLWLSELLHSSFATTTLGVLLQPTIEATVKVTQTLISFTPLMQTLETGFDQPLLGRNFFANLATGGVLFLIAWALFDRCTRNDIDPGAASWWTKFSHRLRRGRSGGRAWKHAILWKEFKLIGGGWLVFWLKLICYGGLIFLTYWAGRGYRRGFDWDDLAGVSLSYSLFFLFLEIPLMTTRLYRNEMSEKTWSTLVLLPRSLPSLVYAKLAGGLLSVTPGVLFALFGLGIFVPEIIREIGRSGLVGLIFISYFIMQFLIGLHVATWLSIAYRWAVWPLAIFLGGMATVACNMILVPCFMFGGGNGEAEFVILDFIAAGINITLHVVIGKSLQRAAADG